MITIVTENRIETLVQYIYRITHAMPVRVKKHNGYSNKYYGSRRAGILKAAWLKRMNRKYKITES